RLLAFDRDPTTRGPTVEVAHEALLRSWDRLRLWIDDARGDLLQHRRLAAAAADWEASGRDPGLLPRGRRLEELASWAASSELILSRSEDDYLAAGVHQSEEELHEEIERAERERTLERRSVVRLRALVAVLTAAVLVAAGLTTIAVSRAREAEQLRDDGLVDALVGSSLSALRDDPDLSALLALHAVQRSVERGQRVPSTTVEALHWAMQEAGVTYPVEDGQISVVAGPLGPRGVFDLPVAQLANATRSHVPRQLTPGECSRYFGPGDCPTLPLRFDADIDAESVTPVPPPPGRLIEPLPPLAGTRVTMFWPAHADEEALGPFSQELDRFTEETGVEVDIIDFPQLNSWITAEQAEGDPPDLATAIPGIVFDLGRRGHLVDLGTFVDSQQLEANQSPYLVSLGTLGRDGAWPAERGHLFGAFTSLSVKGLVWYPKPELQQAGFAAPATWEELTALSSELKAAGETPWCMGFESGSESGWPATDWIENLVLAGGGPATYDAWTFHELPFDSPPVRRAFEEFGDLVFEEGSVVGGSGGAAETFFLDAQRPMLEDPPGCWLYLFPTFAAVALDPSDPGLTTDTFPFPPMRGQPESLIGGGEMIGAFSDRPEVRELVRWFLSPEHGVESAEQGIEFMSPNRAFDMAHYHPFLRQQSAVVQAALAENTFRFDASDLMPPPIAEDLFFAAMMKYLREGPESLDGILQGLDAAWPDTG
ncbi:MAG: ABC transporter substrate-binding protein, partial [Actinomycetota bacterium]